MKNIEKIKLMEEKIKSMEETIKIKKENNKKYVDKCLKKKKENGLYRQICEICGGKYDVPSKTKHINTKNHQIAVLKQENDLLKKQIKNI